MTATRHISFRKAGGRVFESRRAHLLFLLFLKKFIIQKVLLFSMQTEIKEGLTIDKLVSDGVIESIEAVEDELVKALLWSGYSLRDFAKFSGVDISIETIRTRIKESGQHPTWIALRKMNTKQGRKKFYRTIMDLLINVALKKSREEGFVVEKASRYFFNYCFYPSSTITLKQLLTLFEVYKSALDEGKRVSVYEFANISGVQPSTISRIFKICGIKTLYHQIERHNPTPQQEEMIRQTFLLGLSSEDASYFSGNTISINVLQRRYKKMRKGGPVPDPHFKRFGKGEGRPSWGYQLTLRRASQIFEAQDAGSSLEEIAELLDAPKAAIKYAERRRPSYSAKIIRALDTFFPNEISHTNPYL